LTVSTITRMILLGGAYRIVLDCGHTIERTIAEVKMQQLYIEKRIGCPECGKTQEEWGNPSP
jgi:hypothetical protein